MKTLLVLGSKPEPCLPHSGEYADVACANASGHSAARYGLPDPVFTAISAVVTSGIASGRQSLGAMRGLHTRTLYFLPRTPKPHRGWIKRLKDVPTAVRASPFWFKRSLHQVAYEWDEFVARRFDEYLAPVTPILSREQGLLAQLAEKRPSTGLMALIIGMSLERYDRFILSGFSFELTHSYAANPEIQQRGTVASRHAPTDIRILRALSAGGVSLWTTEPVVHEQAGLPLLEPKRVSTG